jgi:hypothetical protein
MSKKRLDDDIQVQANFLMAHMSSPSFYSLNNETKDLAENRMKQNIMK